MRRTTKATALLALSLGVGFSSGGHADEMVTLSVRLRASSVSELVLSLPKSCVGALDGTGPVYEVIDVDVGCALDGKPPMTPGMRRIVFQVHGRSPSVSAPDSNAPHRLTEEDRKALEAVGPLAPEPAVATFPITGQVTSSHPMSDITQNPKDADGNEYYSTADTVWLDSNSLQSQAMECVSVWKSNSGTKQFVPIGSRCHVWLNYDNIELVAVLDLTSAITLNSFEQLLEAFEKTNVVR